MNIDLHAAVTTWTAEALDELAPGLAISYAVIFRSPDAPGGAPAAEIVLTEVRSEDGMGPFWLAENRLEGWPPAREQVRELVALAADSFRRARTPGGGA